ncbi:hypothetical protein QJS10_CPB15g01590 [Acorus calamus]|uniref:Pentatricopeptide repeat-containing protein n=1 Tax=Acorus calamus TaxID=4465 RepID=A0AAV9D5X4_ACOCL|nr:hypothetical protein QJS10_CPB15g01590 [Acorus calamus]
MEGRRGRDDEDGSRPYSLISKHTNHLISSTLLTILKGEIKKPQKSDPYHHRDIRDDQRITPSMLLRIMDLSPSSNHKHLLHFLLSSYENTETYGGSMNDNTLPFIIDHFLRRRDYSSISHLFFPNKFEPKSRKNRHHVKTQTPAGKLARGRTASVAVRGLIRACRPKEAVAVFKEVNIYYERYKIVADVAVELWSKGYTGHAGSVMRFYTCRYDDLASTIVEKLGPAAAVPVFNGMLHDILRRDTAADADDRTLISGCSSCGFGGKDYTLIDVREFEKVLIEMDAHGVPLNVKTFNIILYYLAKIQRADDARLLFQSMEQRGITPNSRTYVIMARAFYKARRFDEGDEMVMKAGSI